MELEVGFENLAALMLLALTWLLGYWGYLAGRSAGVLSTSDSNISGIWPDLGFESWFFRLAASCKFKI